MPVKWYIKGTDLELLEFRQHSQTNELVIAYYQTASLGRCSLVVPREWVEFREIPREEPPPFSLEAVQNEDGDTTIFQRIGRNWYVPGNEYPYSWKDLLVLGTRPAKVVPNEA